MALHKCFLVHLQHHQQAVCTGSALSFQFHYGNHRISEVEKVKITKTAKQNSVFDQNRIDANIGCDKCPCCGESKLTLHYIKRGILNKGILQGIEKTWVSLFGMKNMKCDCYKCCTCGAEWESEPYQWT